MKVRPGHRPNNEIEIEAVIATAVVVLVVTVVVTKVSHQGSVGTLLEESPVPTLVLPRRPWEPSPCRLNSVSKLPTLLEYTAPNVRYENLPLDLHSLSEWLLWEAVA